MIETGMLIGVDSGGTFTDVVALDEFGLAHVVKVESRPADVAGGIAAGVEAGAAGSPIGAVIHGTTVATNAVLEERGARTAVLTTAGFEDVLDIGRLKRTSLYDMQIDPETPGFLSPRELRFGVAERVDSGGNILQALDENEVIAIARRLADLSVDSVAVCYLFSFLNPRHEARTREVLERELPGVAISTSSEIDPTFREYERLCVTAFNAYLAPFMSSYLHQLSSAVGSPVDIMQSRGSIVEADRAAEIPVTTLLSGPAAGVIAAAAWVERVGSRNAVTFDMGGTSTDASVILDGKPVLWREGSIGRYPVRTPMIAIQTVGAGGGSVGWRDSAGELRVGPHSAGARPGPACYGRGGNHPTVTDASLALGYLGESIANGSVALDRDGAIRALATLGSPDEIAQGIHRIVNARMTDHIRLMTVRRGISPKGISLIAFGGAGPMHAVEVARQLSIAEVIIPLHPGVLSAEGLLLSPAEQEHIRSGRFSPEQVNAELRELELSVDPAIIVSRWADMRYVGQAYELPVPIVGDTEMRAAFEEVHEQAYGYRNPNADVEATGIRIITRLRSGHAVERYKEQAVHAVPVSHRRVWFPDMGWHDVEVRNRVDISGEIRGPMLIDDHDATTVLPPNSHADLHPTGALVINP